MLKDLRVDKFYILSRAINPTLECTLVQKENRDSRVRVMTFARKGDDDVQKHKIRALHTNRRVNIFLFDQSPIKLHFSIKVPRRITCIV